MGSLLHFRSNDFVLVFQTLFESSHLTIVHIFNIHIIQKWSRITSYICNRLIIYIILILFISVIVNIWYFNDKLVNMTITINNCHFDTKIVWFDVAVFTSVIFIYYIYNSVDKNTCKYVLFYLLLSSIILLGFIST